MVEVLENLNKEEKLVFRLRKLFESYGYEKIAVNLLEEYESYYLHGELFKVDSLLKVIDPNGKLFVLRPDMTMPIAKKFAKEKKDYLFNNKVYYSDDVFRIKEGNIGSILKEKQVGIELLGEKNLYSDYEVLKLAVEALRIISPKYHIDLSHVKFLEVIFEKINFNYDEKEEIFEHIQNRAESEIRKILENKEIEEKIKEILIDIPSLYGPFEEVIEKVKNYGISEFEEIIDELEELRKILPKVNIELDLSMVNNINYYTGIIFKGYLEGLSQVALQGGRYDTLAKNFGRDFDAVGFGINLDEIFSKLVKDEVTTKGSLVLIKDYEGIDEILDDLRADGKRIKVERYTEEIGKKIDELKDYFDRVYVVEGRRGGEL